LEEGILETRDIFAVMAQEVQKQGDKIETIEE